MHGLPLFKRERFRPRMDVIGTLHRNMRLGRDESTHGLEPIEAAFWSFFRGARGPGAFSISVRFGRS